MSDEDPIEMPIDGTLDLHNFHPRDVKELLPEYLYTCHQKGILQVRVVHGKGTGTLREIVHAQLKKMPEAVEDYALGGAGGGSWGATIVRLRPDAKFK